jgi:hypothetical protein
MKKTHRCKFCNTPAFTRMITESITGGKIDFDVCFKHMYKLQRGNTIE